MRWHVHGERSLYESEWVRLSLVDVELPSGRRFEHHVVRMPAPAAGVVVTDPDHDGVLLLWRHRFTTDTWGWEIPAGRVDPGESPIEAGHRETLEETGWRPGPLRSLVSYFPYNGISDGTFHLFAADRAEHVGDPDRHRRGRAGGVGSVGRRAVGDRRRAGRRRALADRPPVGPRPLDLRPMSPSDRYKRWGSSP